MITVATVIPMVWDPLFLLGYRLILNVAVRCWFMEFVLEQL